MKSEFREVEIFIAEDGEEFFDDTSCALYEEKLNLERQIRTHPIADMERFLQFKRKYEELYDA